MITDKTDNQIIGCGARAESDQIFIRRDAESDHTTRSTLGGNIKNV
jgi:hypothetical protein